MVSAVGAAVEVVEAVAAVLATGMEVEEDSKARAEDEADSAAAVVAEEVAVEVVSHPLRFSEV